MRFSLLAPAVLLAAVALGGCIGPEDPVYSGTTAVGVDEVGVPVAVLYVCPDEGAVDTVTLTSRDDDAGNEVEPRLVGTLTLTNPAGAGTHDHPVKAAAEWTFEGGDFTPDEGTQYWIDAVDSTDDDIALQTGSFRASELAELDPTTVWTHDAVEQKSEYTSRHCD